MKAKAKNIEECTTCFEIELSKDDITKAFDEVYAEMTKVANIPGFRAGKAPLDVVKKHYAKDAREEVLKRLIPESYRNALAQHSIRPIGFPEISEVKFVGEEELSFKAKVDTRPKFKLKDYKGIKIEKKKVAVTDEEVDKTLQGLREMNAKYIAVENRPVKMGDYVVSDLDCFIDDKPAHKKRENLWLYVDEESLVPELSKKMVGMNKGEEKDIEAAFPEKYPDKNMAGKPAKYHILAKEIKERQLPVLDDEFAKDLGRTGLEDLKKEVRKELEARAASGAQIDMENQLLGKLMDDNIFAVPSSFVKRQSDYMVEDSKRRLEEKGFKREELDKKDSEFREKFKNDAVRQVRLLFILDEIANAEKIKVSEKDVEESYKAISLQAGKSEDEIKNYYEAHDLVDNLKEKLREAKTIRFLIEKSQVTEV